MKPNVIEFDLRPDDEFIPLIQLLKATGVVESGSEAQDVVVAGLVRREGQTETRKRAKIRRGETIEFQNFVIKVVG